MCGAWVDAPMSLSALITAALELHMDGGSESVECVVRQALQQHCQSVTSEIDPWIMLSCPSVTLRPP